MPETWDQDRIQKLIDDQTEESLILEYKGKDSLGKSPGKKREITKDVSAMANSAGGTLIYGVSEDEDSEGRKLPKEIEPIDPSQFSCEWLQQVINNIRPRIESTNSISVSVETGPARGIVYVVEIAQSATAHQAQDHKYYKRFHSLNVPMEDYEIRDIMARIKHPKIEIEFKIYCSFERSEEESQSSQLKVIARNAGPVYARYIICELLLPAIILAEPIDPEDFIMHDGNEYIKCSPSNAVRDVVDNVQNREKYGPTWHNPLLPRKSQLLSEIDITKHSKSFDNQGDIVIHWEVCADNAPPNSGKISLDKIPEEFGQ